MDPTSIIFNMTSEQSTCPSCENEILCAVLVLSATDCSMAGKRTIQVAGRLKKQSPVAGTGILERDKIC